MFERILVPLDGSRFSEFALPLAASLASRFDASLHFVTVSLLPTEGLVGLDPAVVAGGRAVDSAEAEAERYLQDVQVRVRDAYPDVRATWSVLTKGPVVEALRNEGDREEADLVLMTTHGRGGVQRAWFGSVAEGLVRIADVPVLLVRPGREAEEGEATDLVRQVRRPFQQVLVPLDGSPTAEEALAGARTVAETDGAALTLLQVIPPRVESVYPFHTVPVPQRADADAEGRRQAEEYLAGVAEGLEKPGLEVRTLVLVSSHPAGAILGHVQDAGIDLVVMTTRGHGVAGRLLLGSVADKVARGSDVPVLVQRAAAGGDDEGGASA